MTGLLNTVQTLCSGSNKPKRKVVYAVRDGKLRGEFLVLVDEDEKNWTFFAFYNLPEFYLRHIPKNEFETGIKLGIVDEVETLPDDIGEFIDTQYRVVKA